ncbi:MAG: RidA family protein [Chloroflexota bacterium]
MPKQTINPPDLFNSVQFGFSQIVTASGSKTVYISGQVAWNAQQEIVGGDDLEKQTHQSLRNVECALQAADGSLSNVVSLRIYFVDAKRDDIGCISRALLTFFPNDDLPAMSLIGVASLANDAFLVEIETTAVLD